MKNGDNKIERLLDFLQNDDVEDTAVLRGNLEKAGVDLSRIEARLASSLKDADRAIKRKALERASEERSKFGESLKDAAKNLFGFSSRQELMDAILKGRFGETAQGRLQVQFRNRNPEELSDNDLKGLLEDQQILELLEKNRINKK